MKEILFRCVNIMCKYCDTEYDGNCGAHQITGNINDIECACFIQEKRSLGEDKEISMSDIAGGIELGQLFNVLYAEIDRLKLEIENLKCCGNCANYDGCTCLLSIDIITYYSRCCAKWVSDNMTREDRE